MYCGDEGSMRSSLRGWKVMGGRNLIFVPTQPLISSFAVLWLSATKMFKYVYKNSPISNKLVVFSSIKAKFRCFTSHFRHIIFSAPNFVFHQPTRSGPRVQSKFLPSHSITDFYSAILEILSVVALTISQ
jgi:hypothetical protein